MAPADCVIVSTGDCVEVAVDESHLTGESDDVRKTSAGAPVLLGGSKVLEGQCEALAIAVGANSQAGLVTAMVRGQDGKSAPGDGKSAPGDASPRSLSADEKTVLQGKLESLALAIGRVGFYAGAFVALLSWNAWQHRTTIAHTFHVCFASGAALTCTLAYTLMAFVAAAAHGVFTAVAPFYKRMTALPASPARPVVASAPSPDPRRSPSSRPDSQPSSGSRAHSRASASPSPTSPRRGMVRLTVGGTFQWSEGRAV